MAVIACASDATCATGSCQILVDPAGTALTTECAPGVGPSALGSACSQSSDCNDDLCINGFCSGPCADSSECANGGVCTLEPVTVSGMTASFDVCVITPCAVPGLDVEPSTLQTITVQAGQMTPTVTFDTLLDCGPVSAAWDVDKGNIATIAAGPSQTAVLVPTGQVGGLVTVTAGFNGKTVSRQVFIKLVASQNGPNGSSAEAPQIPTTTGQLTAGGGVGGVGGVGLGSPVASNGTLTALQNPTGNVDSVKLALLYPYDATVWPRGLLAPLLQWTSTLGSADAIQIQLNTTTGSFSYTGTFGPPPILQQVAGSFVNMPIPQDVWAMATNTAGGTDKLMLSLTIAKGNVGYGPIQETWTVAPGLLSGTIYYNSYGTALVKNYSGPYGTFGGAILSIQVGATAPVVAAGTNTMTSGCRTCHSVAANGSQLVVQHGDSYGTSSDYTLGTAGNTEHPMSHNAAPGMWPPAMFPDGSMALSNGGQLLPLPTDTTPIATTGLTTLTTNLGQPAFSPDGTKLVFNPAAGSLTNNQTLYVMTFNKATMAFSSPVLIASDVGSAAQVKPGWPAFFPDSKSVVYHHQVLTGIENDLGTRAGNQAQIYWTGLGSPANVTPLANLNGVGYLPKLAAPSAMTCTADGYQVAANPTAGIQANLDHSQDATMNYEPTVNPVGSGGYAWVVFTSRRMYGNVAAIPPYCSDPRGVNLTANAANPLATNITTKKLWVAAVDLTQGAGVDASHPAFYLPAQELLAGNSRGFWSLDPCQADGTSCTSGDQCCNGYCEPNGAGGALICSNTPPNNSCSAIGDKCASVNDCCDPTNACINGFCTQP